MELKLFTVIVDREHGTSHDDPEIYSSEEQFQGALYKHVKKMFDNWNRLATMDEAIPSEYDPRNMDDPYNINDLIELQNIYAWNYMDNDPEEMFRIYEHNVSLSIEVN